VFIYDRVTQKLIKNKNITENKMLEKKMIDIFRDRGSKSQNTYVVHIHIYEYSYSFLEVFISDLKYKNLSTNRNIIKNEKIKEITFERQI
jgi:hypothetical protein